MRRVGDRAALLECGSLGRAIEVYAALAAARKSGELRVDELVPAAETVLVRGGLAAQPEALAELAAALLGRGRQGAGRGADATEIRIPVVYDGEDLAEVAALARMSVEEVVRRHSRASYTVAFTGFAPGFGYLAGGDLALAVPRRATPRTRVPAGAVGLAGEFSGVYPRESPGGWQLIGRTSQAMWEPNREPPALLVPGASVRFDAERAVAVAVAVSAAGPARALVGGVEQAAAASSVAAGQGTGAASSAPAAQRQADRPAVGQRPASERPADRPAADQRPANQRPTGQSVNQRPANQRPTDQPVDQRPTDSGASAVAEEKGTPAFEICEPGLLTLIQDAGRPGHAALGVSRSGAADRGALAAANRLVGNPAGAAAIELGMGGFSARARGSVVMALTGAPRAGTIDGVLGARPVPHGRPFRIDAGEQLYLAHPQRGLRTILALRGGVLAERTLGSASRDTLAALGPVPLAAGDAVCMGPAPRRVVGDPAPVPDLPASGEPVRLRIVLGPRDDWFDDASVAALLTSEWEVTPRSDRVGMRLAGAALTRTGAAQGRELPSEGLVPGAIQVPADGQPLLFLADHPVTGGYPVIGVVCAADLDLAAQLPPGVRISFTAEPPAGG